MVTSPASTAENATFRQSLLQLGNASVGNLGLPELELLQTGQPLEMHNPSVSDLDGVEGEPLKICQPLESVNDITLY